MIFMMPLQGNENGSFPVDVQGWTLAPEAETYTPENLYEYIDGAAELYISYGFEKLFTRRYQRADQPEITVDLFDMGGPGNAFGIFAHSQESPGKAVGRDSEYLDGLLRFWQGRYYGSLLCSPETPESRLALMELGRRLAENLPPDAGRPRSLSLLPLPGLLAGSIRYFHHPAWQNTYVFISAENILEIGPGCEAILAKYDQGGERPVVLLVLYPDRNIAERAFASLRNKFHLPAAGGEAVKLADEKYCAAALEKKVVAAVWHGGGPDPALRLLAALREKIALFEK
ncbi:MAG TPA: DUF6599 family protein [Patescibacteria group bacterium]|nr:DUF6599 family protein [Patescibacteria group bacterium]